MSFHILYVCTGNLCRSVLAERLTRQLIDVHAGQQLSRQIRTASAGTEAVAGRPMHPYVRDILEARSADPADFISQRLSPGLVATADLVLTATGGDRDRAIAMVPAALRRSFTVREFARLAGRATLPGRANFSGQDTVEVSERARASVAAVQSTRGRVPYVEPSTDDLPDPRRSRAAFHRCAEQIEVSLVAILDALGLGEIPIEPAAGPVR